MVLFICFTPPVYVLKFFSFLFFFFVELKFVWPCVIGSLFNEFMSTQLFDFFYYFPKRRNAHAAPMEAPACYALVSFYYFLLALQMLLVKYIIN